jgi:hypothetical protein
VAPAAIGARCHHAKPAQFPLPFSALSSSLIICPEPASAPFRGMNRTLMRR